MEEIEMTATHLENKSRADSFLIKDLRKRNADLSKQVADLKQLISQIQENPNITKDTEVSREVCELSKIKHASLQKNEEINKLLEEIKILRERGGKSLYRFH